MRDPELEPARPRVTVLVRALGWLAAEGASLGAAVVGLAWWDELRSFAATNRMPMSERNQLLLVLLGGALLVPLLACLWVLTRSQKSRRAELLERIGRRGAVALGAGPLVVLLNPGAWQNKSVALLWAIVAFSVLVGIAVRVSLTSMAPVGNPQQDAAAESLRGLLRRLGSSRVPLATVLVAACSCAILRYLAFDPGWASFGLEHQGLAAAWKAWGGGGNGWASLVVSTGHAQFSLALLLAPHRLLPGAETLMVLRAIYVCAGAIPLYLWTRRRLGPWGAVVVALAYLSLPLLASSDQSGPFPVTVAVGFFFLALVCGEAHRPWAATVAGLLAVMVHEQVALWFVVWGLDAALSARRSRPGLMVAGLGLGYFVLTSALIMPRLGSHYYSQGLSSPWSAGETGLGVALQRLVENPAHALIRWLDTQTLEAWGPFLVPLALLPLRGRNWLLWLLPGIAFSTLSPERGSIASFVGTPGAHFVALGTLATVLALARMRGQDVTGRVHQVAASCALVAALLPSVCHHGSLYYVASGQAVPSAHSSFSAGSRARKVPPNRRPSSRRDMGGPQPQKGKGDDSKH